MADKKLFVVNINVGMMVLAEDPEEARELAEMYLEEEINNNAPDRDEFTCSEALTSSKKRVYAEGWSDTDFPYANDDDDDESIGDRFKEIEKR